MRSITALAFSLLILAPALSHAATEADTNATILQVAVSATVATVAVASPDETANCTNNLVNFDPLSTAGRVLLAVLLEAKASGAEVDIVYDRTGGTCTLLSVNSRI